jgi:hypothetical protein
MQTNYDPCYEPLSKETLEKRKMIFKNILYELVNSDHKKFLQSINFTRNFDPFKMKTWHSSFSLENDVKGIPIFEISEKPTIHIVTITKYINDNDFKSDLINKAIQQASIENAKEQQSEEEANGSQQANKEKNNILNNFISDKLFQKVKKDFFINFLIIIFFLNLNY